MGPVFVCLRVRVSGIRRHTSDLDSRDQEKPSSRGFDSKIQKNLRGVADGAIQEV